MVRITVQELARGTGQWVNRAAEQERIIITIQGRPVAVLGPIPEESKRTRFADRQLLPEFTSLPRVAGDTTRLISEDRDRP